MARPNRRKRTPEQERARYNGLSPAAFADAVGVDVDRVYAAIGEGWFRWTKDAAGRQVPECQDVRKKDGKRAAYKIHPTAVARWFEDHAVVGAA